MYSYPMATHKPFKSDGEIGFSSDLIYVLSFLLLPNEIDRLIGFLYNLYTD